MKRYARLSLEQSAAEGDQIPQDAQNQVSGSLSAQLFSMKRSVRLSLEKTGRSFSPHVHCCLPLTVS